MPGTPRDEEWRFRVNRGPTLRIRETVSRPLAMVLGIIPPVLLLVLWWLVTCPESPAENRLINRLLQPSQRETFEANGSLWLDREVSRSALST